MKLCPTCGRDALKNITETNHFRCEACDTNIYHEGNGYVSDTL